MDFTPDVSFVVLTQPISSFLRRQPDVSHECSEVYSLVEQPTGWKTPIAFISWDDCCRQAHNVGASRHQVGPKSNRHALRAGRRWWILCMPGSSRTHLLLDGFPAWLEHICVLFLHITDLHHTVTLNFKTRHNCVKYTQDAYQCNWWPVSLFFSKEHFVAGQPVLVLLISIISGQILT